MKFKRTQTNLGVSGQESVLGRVGRERIFWGASHALFPDQVIHACVYFVKPGTCLHAHCNKKKKKNTMGEREGNRAEGARGYWALSSKVSEQPVLRAGGSPKTPESKSANTSSSPRPLPWGHQPSSCLLPAMGRSLPPGAVPSSQPPLTATEGHLPQRQPNI